MGILHGEREEMREVRWVPETCSIFSSHFYLLRLWYQDRGERTLNSFPTLHSIIFLLKREKEAHDRNL